MARISCDPEVFVAKTPESYLDATLNPNYYPVSIKGKTYRKTLPKFEEEAIPICGLVGGTKDNPIKIPGIGISGFLMQEDGVTLEFNIPPSTSGEEFTQNISRALRSLHSWLFKRGLVILQTNSEHFSQKDLEAHPQALQIGCSLDFDAYKVEARKPPTIDSFNGNRFAGGHVHASFLNKEKMPNEFVIRLLDLYLGLPTIGLDKQNSRRKFYGQAGLFRPTQYPDGDSGVEYRTLSNFWIFDRDITYWIGNTTLRVLNIIEKDPFIFLPLLKSSFWSEIPDIIQDENYKEATKMVSFLSKTLPLPYYPEMW